MKPWLICDIETRSRAELTDVGQWNYSRDPSTQILCVALSKNGEHPSIHDVRDGEAPDLWRQAVEENWEIWARNVAFEYSCITNASRWPQPDLNSWRDSAAVSVVNGFPAGLDACAKAMRLSEQKDGAGTALINFWSKPINSGGHKGEFRNPDDHPEKWAEFLRYCHQDVVTDAAILAALPPLSEHEMRFWLATWRMNVRGIYVDMPLVRGLQSLVDKSRSLIGGQLQEATDGLFDASVTSNHRRVLEYVNEHDARLDSVAKPKVREALTREDLTDEARVVLEARQALGKTSVAKLDALLLQTGDDSRLRFLFRPHGTETGRDTSMGVQVTNLPRGGKFPTDKLVSAAREGHEDEFFNLSYEKKSELFDPLGAVVTCIRGCFAATPGTRMVQCDWSAVEPRIGAWLVEDEEMLAAFRLIDEKGGIDIYQIEAARFYNCKAEEIVGDRRQFGKVFVLGSQYGAGGPKLQLFAKDVYGVILTDDEAQVAVDVWRALHPKWTRMWANLSMAAMSATTNVGKVFKCGRVAFCHNGMHLKMRLPSGRLLTLPYARVKRVTTPWGTEQDQLHYSGISGLTKQWREFPIAGPALFNRAVQSCGACILRESVIKLDDAGRKVVLRVHDELIEETDQDDGLLKSTMLEVPVWAEGLPLNGAGWCADRYNKS